MGTVIRNMADFKIHLFVTYDEWGENGYQAGYNINDYIEDAFSDMQWSVNVDVKSERPNPPTEAAYDDGDGPRASEYPIQDTNCYGYQSEFSYLHDWFKDIWMPCQDSSLDAKDTNLLITNWDGQIGSTFSEYACVEGGSYISQVTSVNRKTCTDNSEYVQSALHEVGHSICWGNEPSGYNHEQMGNTEVESHYDGSVYNYQTPMITYQDPDDCGYNNPYSNYGSGGTYDCRKMIWSQCMRDYIQPN